MKIINALIYIVGFQYTVAAQDEALSIQQPLRIPVKETKMNYVISLNDPAFAKTECQEIEITGIPMSTLVITSLNMELETPGNFSFKKHSSLQIPYGWEVFIEDKLTGKTFNLKSSKPYTFHTNQYMANRFVMHVLNKTNPQCAVSAN